MGSQVAVDLNGVEMTSRPGDNIRPIQRPSTDSRKNLAHSGGSFYSEIRHPTQASSRPTSWSSFMVDTSTNYIVL